MLVVMLCSLGVVLCLMVWLVLVLGLIGVGFVLFKVLG